MENLTRSQIVLLVLLVSFVTSLATGIVTVTLVRQDTPPITNTINRVVEKSVPVEVKTKTVVLNSEDKEDKIVKTIKSISPAVVGVIASKNISMFGENKNSSGAGFFVSKDGLILTNKHIVEDAPSDYSVMTNDGKIIPVKVVYRDPFQDVAVLKAEGDNFNFAPLGDSQNINIGQTVIAIGNTQGESQNTVSVGVVSGLKKKMTAYGSAAGSIYVAVGGMESLGGLIQTSAVVGLADSGGPLVDLSGRVIGISTIGVQAGNYGFALPIESAKKNLANIAK